jgi:hypothetical protein
MDLKSAKRAVTGHWQRLRPSHGNLRCWSIVIGVLFLLNVVFLIRPMRRLLSDLSAMPQGLWTFVGVLLGLSAVAGSTCQGFRNLIQAQNHRGELDRDARSHQAKLSEDAKRADQDREAQVVAAAISAELVALVPGVQRSLSLLKGYKVILDAVGKADKSVKSPIVFPEFMTPIYDANVAKLGLLGASIASDVVTVYAMAKIKPKNTEDQFVAAGLRSFTRGSSLDSRIGPSISRMS